MLSMMNNIRFIWHNFTENIISKVDAAIIVTAHDEFKTLKPSLFSQTSNSILIDTRGVIDPTEAKQEKLIFRGLGRGD